MKVKNGSNNKVKALEAQYLTWGSEINNEIIQPILSSDVKTWDECLVQTVYNKCIWYVYINII